MTGFRVVYSTELFKYPEAWRVWTKEHWGSDSWLVLWWLLLLIALNCGQLLAVNGRNRGDP
jgi:hypothetical protein